MRRAVVGLMAAGLLVTACAEPDRLTDAEAMWCRATQPGFHLLDAGEAIGVDLTDVVEESRRIADAPGTIEERQAAMIDAYALLEADAGYVEVCRSLYDEAGRPFDLDGDLP